MIVFPNSKINLGLTILDKRLDGFHNLETIFYPVALQDALEIIQNATSNKIEFTASGLAIELADKENICVSAYRLLKKDFPRLPFVKIHLHKAVPIGGGLGGGSADGAFSLLLLNKKFNLELTEEQLNNYALQLGSDCPFFLKNKPCLATGRGEVLEELPLDLSAYKFVLVNPGIQINTGWAFSQLNLTKEKRSVKEIIQLPVEQWKDLLQNDFEELIFNHYPEIKNIKEILYQQGAVYAAMSGSGSSVYGLFEQSSELKFDFPINYFVKFI